MLLFFLLWFAEILGMVIGRTVRSYELPSHFLCSCIEKHTGTTGNCQDHCILTAGSLASVPQTETPARRLVVDRKLSLFPADAENEAVPRMLNSIPEPVYGNFCSRFVDEDDENYAGCMACVKDACMNNIQADSNFEQDFGNVILNIKATGDESLDCPEKCFREQILGTDSRRIKDCVSECGSVEVDGECKVSCDGLKNQSSQCEACVVRHCTKFEGADLATYEETIRLLEANEGDETCRASGGPINPGNSSEGTNAGGTSTHETSTTYPTTYEITSSINISYDNNVMYGDGNIAYGNSGYGNGSLGNEYQEKRHYRTPFGSYGEGSYGKARYGNGSNGKGIRCHSRPRRTWLSFWPIFWFVLLGILIIGLILSCCGISTTGLCCGALFARRKRSKHQPTHQACVTTPLVAREPLRTTTHIASPQCYSSPPTQYYSSPSTYHVSGQQLV